MVGLEKLFGFFPGAPRFTPVRNDAAPAPSNEAAPAPDVSTPAAAPWQQAVAHFFKSIGDGMASNGANQVAPTMKVLATGGVVPVNSATPASKLDDIKITSDKTVKDYGPTPWTWNKWLPKNGGKDSPEYKHWRKMHNAAEGLIKAEKALPGAVDAQKKAVEARDAAKKTRDDALVARDAAKAEGDKGKLSKAETALKNAEKGLTTAEGKLKTADTALKKAQDAVPAAKKQVETTSEDFKKYLKSEIKTIRSNDPEWKAAKADVAKAEKALADGKKAKLDDAALKTLTDDVTAKKKVLSDREKALDTEIDNYKPIDHYDKRVITAEIDGKKVTLVDHIDAYSTELGNGLSAKTADGGKQGVIDAVDNSSLSADDKKIMKAISAEEGNFATTESYDNGGVTWGMMQWTTGKKGNGSVIDVMEKVKKDHPDAYKKRFSNYGIDTENGSLKVTKPDGTVLRGADAVEAVRTDPKLSAVFAAAGTDKDVQSTQIEMAKSQKIDKDALNRTATVEVNGKKYTFKVRDIFTSEWGAAVAANAGVHAGPGAVQKRFEAGLKAYFEKHPDADPTKVSTWAAQAETEMSGKMIGGDTNRAKNFEDAGLSKTAGSYGN